jgi:hypothetical protein
MAIQIHPAMTEEDKRYFRSLNRRKIVTPGPGQHVGECQFSKTGFAVWNDDGGCTCNPAKKPKN